MNNIEQEIIKWLFFSENNGTITWSCNNVLKIDDVTQIGFNPQERVIGLIDASPLTLLKPEHFLGGFVPTNFKSKVHYNVFSEESCRILWDMYDNHNRPLIDEKRNEALNLLKSRIEVLK